MAVMDIRNDSQEWLTLWLEGVCDAEVVDAAGTLLDCGHQRPEEVARRWEARERTVERTLTGPESVGPTP